MDPQEGTSAGPYIDSSNQPGGSRSTSSPTYSLTSSGVATPNYPYPHQILPVVQAPPIIQFDHKKIPAFFFDPIRDSLTIEEWIQRLDSMRQSNN